MPYSCFIIGDGTLLIDCTTILFQQGFRVMGIISQDQQVHTYCDQAGLRYVESLSMFAAVLEEEPFDFLFSITNGYILPQTILQLPRYYTINYHDGPLPAYAGVHATFWALVNGEKAHGITWHVVETGIDTGAILKQTFFPIEANETSISLNTKSYTAAIDSFRELVDELLQDKVAIQPQNLSRRSYYARSKRPDLFLNWSQPAAVIDRLHRALDFGFHPNPFGYLKIWVGNRFLIAREITVTTTASQQPPGTVEAILSDSVLIATEDYLLAISAFQTLYGEPVLIEVLCEQTGLAEGQVLVQAEPAIIQSYRNAETSCSRYLPYWIEKFARFHPTTFLWPNPVGLVNDTKVDCQWITLCLNPTVQTAIEARSSLGSTSNQLLTALLITLARLANQTSVQVAYQSPLSRQMASDTAGLLAKYVPFQVDFDWEAGFEEAVTYVQREQASSEEHLTFRQDVLASQPALHTVAQELIQHGFPIVVCRKKSGDTEDDSMLPEKAITIILVDDAHCQVVFNPTFWSAHWVNDFMNRWRLLLENVVSQPNQPLKAVPLLTKEEQRRMLVDWNATSIPYPRDQTIHQLVEEQVSLRPQSEALRCGTTGLTYQQLNQQANQLARYLQKQGVTANTLVGLCLERSPEMVISLLAILKAGGAYVPLDPAYPAIRLNELMTQTGVCYVISQKTWLNRLPTQGVYILLDEDQAFISQEDDQNVNVPLRAEQLAYVLFTSGSTGRSKGVAIPHRGVIRLVKGANFMRLDETVCMLGLAPLAFDASTLEIWGSLTNGGRLVLIPESRPSLETIKQTIQTQSVNAAFFTAALFNVLVDSGISELNTITQLLTGGEAASAEHVFRARRQLPSCTLINGYGPTESTTFASFYSMSAGDWETSSVPIGRPISNTQLYIVDSFLNPVPVGIQGELLIGGDGLAREYLHQPELTRQKFISDPFRDQSEGRLYRTGDQARFLADGTIEFLGRLDDQIKIRGHRIEPGEIEQALCQHPTVGAAVVLVDESVPENKRLVAYLVPASGSIVQPEDLRTFLKTSLPDYLIPNAVVPINVMPLTANGKVDKARLPPAFGRETHQNDRLNPTETVMALLWATVLKQPYFSAADHFFELGGSSLLAIQLISQIYRQFGLRLSMNDIFEHPTLHQLSACIDQKPQQEVPPIAAFDLRDITHSKPQFPLSSAQKRLWIIDQIDGSQGAYNVPIVLTIQGRLDLLALQESLNGIIRRHKILHTTFDHINGLPFQQIEPAFSLVISVNELPAATKNETDTFVRQWITDEAYRPFDLLSGPLFRASVVQTGEVSWVLLLVFHHIVYDGFSTRVLAHEMSLLYSSRLRNEIISLPQLPFQYVDYAQWQTEQHKPDSLKRELVYWKNRLTDVAPLLKLPIDKPRPPIQSFAGADYSFVIPERLWQLLRYDLREPGTTPFLRLLTVFAVWLQQVANTNDVVIGIPVAGRTRPELDSLLGFFVNTLPLRIAISSALTYRHLLRNVRQLTLEALEHQAIPYEQIVEEIKPPRTLAYSPLVQVLFDFQEDITNYWQLDRLTIEPAPFVQHMAKFDLHLSIRETSAGVESTFNYRTELFSDQAVARMAQDFIQLLDQLVSQPDQPLAHLQSDNRPERPTLLTFASEPDHATYHTDTDAVTSALDYALVDTLQSIWLRLLQTASVALDEDFFDIGGHSLLAVQMVAEIQRRTGHNLPVASVFAQPTLRKLATYLKTTHADVVWQPLVAVKPQGNCTPLFLVHPVSGDVGYAYQLASYVSDQQPIYALRAVGLDGIAKPYVSIEEMAAHYVQLITGQQPDGPYALGGYSLGGIIAFEMARQLKQLGKEVNLVAVIDAYPVNPNADTNKVPIRQLLPYYYHYWCSLPKRPALLLPILRKKVPWASQYLASYFRYPPAKKTGSTSINSDEMSQSRPEDLLAKTFRRAYSNYTFKSYDGKVVFLRAVNVDIFGTTQRKVDFGWGQYARQGVDVHQLPGHHESLFSNTETIERIAHIIQSYLTA